MAMGRLSNRLKAAGSGSRLAVDLAPRHAFYDWCNEVLAEAEFDEAVEMLCQEYYKDGVGRPSIPPRILKKRRRSPRLWSGALSDEVR
jgi:hypothetical protein